MAKRRWRIILIAGGLTLIAAVVVTLALLVHPHTMLTANPPGQTILNASRALDEVLIDATFDPLNRTVDVRQTLTLTNRTGIRQRLLVLRTYANAMQSEDTSPAATDELYDACYPDGFSAGSLTMRQVRLVMGKSDEQSPSYAYGDAAQTVFRVSLPEDWLPQSQLTLSLRYTLLIPQAAYRFGESGGVWALGNAFAIPSPFVDGEYLADPYCSIGDPFVSECRNYTVRITAPEDYAVAGTGVPVVEALQNGQRTTRFDALAARDFALCLSAGYQTAETMRDGVLIRAYAQTASGARALLEPATAALACYNTRYGAYPYPMLTLCEVNLPFGGETYPALSWIPPSLLNRGGEALEQAVALQVARQWWYAVVGVDGFRQAWQGDALSMFSLLDAWETAHGRDAREELRFSLVDTAMRLTLSQSVTPGSPVDYFGDWTEFRLVVSNRGAAALCALDTAMGGTLDEFLKRYYDTYAFALVSRQSFETLLAQVTGEDWSPLLSDYLDTYITN